MTARGSNMGGISATPRWWRGELVAMASEPMGWTCNGLTREVVGYSRLSLRCIECNVGLLLSGRHLWDCSTCGGLVCERSRCFSAHQWRGFLCLGVQARGRRQKLCEICRAHRPRRRRTCSLCAWKAGPGCWPQRCWVPQGRCCRWCLEERILTGLPQLVLQIVDACLGPDA